MTDGGGYTAHRYRGQDGLSLYYRDYAPAAGRQPPSLPAILCLAGLSRNSKDFHEPATRFAARGFRVICPDYRGRGQSARDPRPANYAPPAYLEDIRHLLTLLGLHRVIVVGTSLGGLLAMGMGATLPAALAGAVLNDVGPEIPQKAIARIRAYLAARPVFPSWQAAAAYLKAASPHAADGSAAFWLRQASMTFRENPAGEIVCDWDINLLRNFGTAPVPPVWPLFRSLAAIPLLTLRGACSDLLTGETLARMAAEIPAMAQAVIPGAGHAPTLTEPQSIAALDAFLDRFDG